MSGRRAALLVVSLAGAWAASARAAAAPALSGALDLNGSGLQPVPGLNAVYEGETSFDAYHLRLGVAASLAPALGITLEARMSDAADPRVTAASLAYTPRPDRDLHLVAGKIPWVVGTWGARSAPERQPLVGVPLMYQLPTRLPSDAIVPDADSLYRIHSDGIGSDYGGSGESEGMRIVQDAWWDMGAALTGSRRPLELALGVTSGTPGAPSPGRDTNGAKCVLGRLGVAPLPGARAGVSGAYGAYLPATLNAELQAGHRVEDYHQRLVMADAELLAGHAELRAEAFANRWETPTLGSLDARGGYLEGKLTFAPGIYAAARYDLMRFSKLHTSSGEPFPWSDDADRTEAGLGYRPMRGVVLKTVWQRTTLDDGEERSSHDLVAVQAALSF